MRRNRDKSNWHRICFYIDMSTINLPMTLSASSAMARHMPGRTIQMPARLPSQARPLPHPLTDASRRLGSLERKGEFVDMRI